MQFMKRMNLKITDKMVDAYTTIAICGEMLDATGGYKCLSSPFHWALNSLYSDAMKVYIESLNANNGN